MAVTLTYSGFSLEEFAVYQRQTAVMLQGAPANTKYVLQIWNAANTEKLADVRQSPNPAGAAVFKLGEILQNYVQTHPGANTSSPFRTSTADTPWNNQTLQVAREEIFPYIIKVGSDDGTNVTIDVTYIGLDAWNAISDPETTAPYVDNLTISNYRTQGAAYWDPETASCAIPSFAQGLANPLSNRPQVRLADLPGGHPTLWDNLGPGKDINYIYSIDTLATEGAARSQDWDPDGWVLSWYNAIFSELPFASNIGGFRFDWYDGATYHSSNLLPNLLQNNGGPDTYPGQGTLVQWPYNTISLVVGQSGTGNQIYRSASGTTLFSRPAGMTHYYVYPVAVQGSTCDADFPSYSDYPLAVPVRVNIREEYFTEYLKAGKGSDLRGCTDYNPVMFRWTNTMGYQDMAWFTKKNTYSKTSSKKTYFKDNVDYSSDQLTYMPYTDAWFKFDFPNNLRNLQFGGTTTYNNTVDEIFTATSGWMHEEFSQYIQWMFQSPSVTANGFPIELLTTTWDYKTFGKDKLFQYEVRYKLATPLNAQNS